MVVNCAEELCCTLSLPWKSDFEAGNDVSRFNHVKVGTPMWTPPGSPLLRLLFWKKTDNSQPISFFTFSGWGNPDLLTIGSH